MRAADRHAVSPPTALNGPGAKGAKELEKVRAWRADPDTAKKSFPFKVYKDSTVKAALEALFHGKCAYCESFYSAQAPVDVEHFRPKGAVEGATDHPGYWWIAMAWDNLLPSCIDCNRRRRQLTPTPSSSLLALHAAATKVISTGKKDVFPIAGTRAMGEGDNLELEQAYLIDPCREDPGEHLEFHLDPDDLIALILPRALPGGTPALPVLGDEEDVAADAAATGVSERGAVSIQVYGLNRLGLVQARTRVLRHLEFLREMIEEIDAVARKLEDSPDPEARAATTKLDRLIDRILTEIEGMSAPEAPYSALVTQWKHRFLTELV